MPFLHTKRRGLVIERSGAGVVGRKIDEEDITDNYWRFISPEVCFNGEKTEALFKDNIYLRQEAVLISDFSKQDTDQQGTNVQNWVAMNNSAQRLPEGTSHVTNRKVLKYIILGIMRQLQHHKYLLFIMTIGTVLIYRNSIFK